MSGSGATVFSMILSKEEAGGTIGCVGANDDDAGATAVSEEGFGRAWVNHFCNRATACIGRQIQHLHARLTVSEGTLYSWDLDRRVHTGGSICMYFVCRHLRLLNALSLQASSSHTGILEF